MKELKEKAGTAHILSPYVPMPDPVVDAFVTAAGAAPGVVIAEVGSGDGRNLIAAAAKGARAVGYEMDAEALEAWDKVAAGVPEEVLSRITVIRHDVMIPDPALDWATVDGVLLYLTPTGQKAVSPYLLSVLRPGVTVVAAQWNYVSPEPPLRVDNIEFIDQRGGTQVFKLFVNKTPAHA